MQLLHAESRPRLGAADFGKLRQARSHVQHAGISPRFSLPMEHTEPRLTSDEALRLFNILKSDRRSDPHSVQLAWERYVACVEREITERRDHAAYCDPFNQRPEGQ